MKHCYTCRCEEEGELTIQLPMNYFPPGYSIEYIGGEVIVSNRQGDYDYYWTAKFKRDTEGYTSVRFEGEQEWPSASAG